MPQAYIYSTGSCELHAYKIEWDGQVTLASRMRLVGS